MRWMSFMHTQQQMRDRTKTVTRRIGWRNAKPGNRVLSVSKSQGRKRGEMPEFFGPIEFTMVHREPLNIITPDEVAAEGFPEMDPAQFIEMFCEHMRCRFDVVLNRIAFLFVCDECDEIGGVRVDGNGSWVCALCGAFNADTEF